MGKRIFVTGMGIISALGKNLPETFDALSHLRSGIGPIRLLDTIHKDKIPVAEVPFTNEELAVLSGLKNTDNLTRSTLLAIKAVKEAADSARISDFSGTGFISANTVGGMDKSEQFYYDYLKLKKPNPYCETHDCADSTEKVADYFGISEFISTVSTACSSASNAVLMGARLIQSGMLRRVIAGGTECLTKFHLNGFTSLKILDSEPCKPFDKNRAGINLGEGAAYIVMESEEIADDGGREFFFELSGWGNACEAFHQTASSPEGDGAYLAMKKTLEMSGLKDSDIDYINAHGTGTDNNDLSEGRAIERLFAPHIPLVSSTKPFTGHTTSAAGTVEAIITMLGMKYNMVFPNLNFKEQMPELNFKPVCQIITDIKIQHALSNSFGFGGNNTSLIFSKI
ncbi:MAG TPA: beta-ketoacyl-[acyl-carrier-protein] synthase family protein [Bacteroidales bacterium]|nr:beta-ketoacyl-[acyl-carrier-protein] synthase family protein [Bacteroidales bacterium]